MKGKAVLQIVLDTETTGLKVEEGNRIVEIGMIELDLDNFTRTGRNFHKYINPCMAMPESAYEIHGLSDEFLGTKPEFKEIVDEFLEFLGDAPLVIHNASFDLAFVNGELNRLGRDRLKNPVVDTLEIARKEFPELPSRSLDGLCKHFNVDKTARSKHGALLDAELLADVYFKLKGANDGFLKAIDDANANGGSRSDAGDSALPARESRLPPRITDEELQAHAAFVDKLGKEAIWNRYARGGRG